MLATQKAEKKKKKGRASQDSPHILYFEKPSSGLLVVSVLPHRILYLLFVKRLIVLIHSELKPTESLTRRDGYVHLSLTPSCQLRAGNSSNSNLATSGLFQPSVKKQSNILCALLFRQWQNSMQTLILDLVSSSLGWSWPDP